MSYSAEFRRYLMSVVTLLDTVSNTSKKYGEVYRDNDPEKSLIYHTLDILAYYLARLHVLTVGQMQDLNVLFDAIEKLPKGEEFDKLKSELEKVRTSEKEVTLNVSKNIEKELQEWAKSMERARKAQSEYVT